MKNVIRSAVCPIILLAFACVSDMKAGVVQTWVQATSVACICNGNPSFDVGSSFNSGQRTDVTYVSEISGPFTDHYMYSGGSQYAEGWSSADSLGTLKAFSQVDATVPLPQVTADGHSYWGATLLATCSTPGCTSVTYNGILRLHDALTAGNYGQYGGGAFVNLNGSGVLASLTIHDAADQRAASLTLEHQFTVPVGTYFDIGADMTAQTQAQEGYATADASSTGFFALQVLTPGGDYISAGAPFATSVDDATPEPGSIILSSLGCLFLVAVRRRKSPVI